MQFIVDFRSLASARSHFFLVSSSLLEHLYLLYHSATLIHTTHTSGLAVLDLENARGLLRPACGLRPGPYSPIVGQALSVVPRFRRPQ